MTLSFLVGWVSEEEKEGSNTVLSFPILCNAFHFCLAKNHTKCLWHWEPDRRYNFFFSPPAHLCAVTHNWNIIACDVKHQYKTRQVYWCCDQYGFAHWLVYQTDGRYLQKCQNATMVFWDLFQQNSWNLYIYSYNENT